MHAVQHFLASAVLTWSVCSAAGPSTNFWQGLGCFNSTDAQALDVQKDLKPTVFSQQACIDACAGFTVSGVKNGVECWCGNTLKGKHADGRYCDKKCSGYPYITCGGKDAMDVNILYGADISTVASGTNATSSSSLPASTALSATTTTSLQTTTQAADASKSTDKSQPTASAGSGKSGASRGLDMSGGVVMAGLLGLLAMLA